MPNSLFELIRAKKKGEGLMFWYHILWLTAEREGLVVRCTHREKSLAHLWYVAALFLTERYDPLEDFTAACEPSRNP